MIRKRKITAIRQRDSMHCGVTCLAMICRYYGSMVTVEELGRHCRATKTGVSLKGIADAASDLGLETRAGRLTLDTLGKCPLPAIIHWDQKHFVVLHRISPDGKRYYVADPAKGKVTYTEEEFGRHWLSTGEGTVRKGVAMFLQPSPDFDIRKEKEERSRRSLGFLMGYLRRYGAYFSQILLGLLLACLLQLVMPFLTQAIVDSGIKGKDISLIWLIVLGELMIVAGRTVTDFIRRWLLLHISMRVNISLLSDFLAKLLRLPMDFFESRLNGDILQRMNDHTRVQQFLTGQVLGVMFTFMSFLVFGAVLLIYDLRVFLIFLGGSVVYAAWMTSFLRRRRLIDYELFECQSLNQSRTYQMVNAMQEIKQQGCGGRRKSEWEDIQADLFMVQMRSLHLRQSQEAGAIFINEVKNILITVFAATAVIDGHITLGAMLAIQYIVGQLNSPVDQIMAFIYSLQDVKISLERINEVHCHVEEGEGASEAGVTPDGGIRLSGVTFRYDRHAPEPTIDNVSLEIPEGKVTALVGSSGCGKTTLMKLMLGFYAPQTGDVTVGGTSVSKIMPDVWRGMCGAVMQEGVVFDESIARNIAVGDGDIDSERMRAAAKIACIDTYIEGLPLRYDTIVGNEGTGLSRGQKQRLLIARAVYKNPEYIFLDEATNALDARNEREITTRLNDFYKGKTVVVAAHRLSTVKNADKIVVIDRGHIVESGTHHELVAAKGAYYDLVRNQLELGT